MRFATFLVWDLHISGIMITTRAKIVSIEGCIEDGEWHDDKIPIDDDKVIYTI